MNQLGDASLVGKMGYVDFNSGLKEFPSSMIGLENTNDRLNQSKESSTNNLLKYSAIDLKEHLDKQGMDWDNHEIDHKIPVTWFIKTTPPNIVNDLRNLQPLSKEENTTKGNKYSHQVNKEYYNLVLKYIKEDFKESLAF
jgi:hypothetical protein